MVDIVRIKRSVADLRGGPTLHDTQDAGLPHALLLCRRIACQPIPSSQLCATRYRSPDNHQQQRKPYLPTEGGKKRARTRRRSHAAQTSGWRKTRDRLSAAAVTRCPRRRTRCPESQHTALVYDERTGPVESQYHRKRKGQRLSSAHRKARPPPHYKVHIMSETSYPGPSDVSRLSMLCSHLPSPVRRGFQQVSTPVRRGHIVVPADTLWLTECLAA